jgi:hypothetical protein
LLVVLILILICLQGTREWRWPSPGYVLILNMRWGETIWRLMEAVWPSKSEFLRLAVALNRR